MRYLFMIQKIFFLIGTNTKIRTEIIDLVVFRKKLQFRQGDPGGLARQIPRERTNLI